MTTYYEILRPVTPADLDTRPSFVKLLKMIPPGRYVKRDYFKNIKKSSVGKGLTYACSKGILKRISPYEQVMKLKSIKFWCTQFNRSNHKNTVPACSTKNMYLRAVSGLNEWLPGNSFKSYKTVLQDKQIIKQVVAKSFANVEELMEHCNTSDYDTKVAQRVVREYLASLQTNNISDGTFVIIRAAIKSYFNAQDIVLNLPKARKKQADQTAECNSLMTLKDFYKMLQTGNPGIKMKTIMIIKLQSGMDSSTFVDRFNYEGYSQIAKYFKTEDHKSWNIEMCPVPIKITRVKTGVHYTTFLDRDAITQLKEYLTWKETKYGKQDKSKPLFMTKQNIPIRSSWLSTHFSEIAVRAGIQEKVSHMMYKIRAHEVRDLLKSTLIMCGCAQYAADHVLGHAPKDSYEKQAILYPEQLRAEYAKASPYINIFSKVESALNTADNSERLHARIRELEEKVQASKAEVQASKAEVQASKEEALKSKEEALKSKEEALKWRGKVQALKEEAQASKAEIGTSKQPKTEADLTESGSKHDANETSEKIENFKSRVDPLPDDAKKKMMGRFEDSDSVA